MDDRASFEMLINCANVTGARREDLPNGNRLVVYLSGPAANWFVTAAEVNAVGEFVAKRTDHPFALKVAESLPRI